MPNQNSHYNPDTYEESPPVGFIDGLIVLFTMIFSFLFFRNPKK